VASALESLADADTSADPAVATGAPAEAVGASAIDANRTATVNITDKRTNMTLT
jgi:hypothetical protein